MTHSVKLKPPQTFEELFDSSDPNDWSPAFHAWTNVYIKCVRFNKDFFNNPDVEWAKKKQKDRDRAYDWKRRGEGITIGILGSLTAALLIAIGRRLFC